MGISNIVGDNSTTVRPHPDQRSELTVLSTF